jgi:hypothetical protein
VILIRLCTLWFAVVVGIVFMIILLARSKSEKTARGKFLQEAPPASPFKNT